MDRTERDIYIIPPNFIESGTLFGGMIKVRNAVEAGILACVIGIPVFVCIPFGLTAKIVTLCLTALPAALVALIGIDGESLSSFLLIWLRYRRNRRVIGTTEVGDQSGPDLAAEKTKRTGTLSREKKKEKAGKQAMASRKAAGKRHGKVKREDFPAEFDELKKYEMREKLRKAGKPRQKPDGRKAAEMAPASTFVKKSEKKENEKILKKRTGSEKSGTQEKEKRAESCLNPVADYLPVEKIQDGIIYTRDHRYLSILEITPVNFLLRSAREQKSIIYSYLSYLKISPVKLQIKVITRKADINRHLDTVREEMEKETNEHCLQMQKDYIEFVKKVGSQEAVTRRFFLIFEYEPWNPSQRENETEAVSFLKSAVHTASAYLRNCGNGVLRPENEDEEAAKALYDILCRKESVFKPFHNKVSEVVAAYAVHGKNAFHGKNTDAIPASEFFSPNQIDFTRGDSVQVDGLYYSWLLIPSEGYRTQVPAGWLSLIVNAGDGIDMDLFLFRQPKEQIVQKVGQQLRINRSKIKDASDTNTDYDDIDGAIRSGYYLKSGIANNEDFYYINLLITITAESREELEWKEAEMKKLLLSQDMQVRSCHYREEQAYLSSLPFLSLDKKLYERSRRNVLSSSAAACYPYISYEMCDDNGVMLGVNRYNSSLVVLDLFDTATYKNANMVILGTSGAGKTFTMQLLALRMRRKGIPVFIIAPLKGHEFRRACEKVGGSYSLLAPGSRWGINIMEIRKLDCSVNELLDGPEQFSALAEKIQHLHIFFWLMIPDMNYEERQLLDEAIILTYEKKGITYENDSLNDPENPEQYREMPILGDVYDILVQSPETARMAKIMKQAIDGSARNLNQQTNVELNNDYNVLDISRMSGELLPLVLYTALEYVWDRAKADRTEEKAVFIDECWQLLSATSAEGSRMAGDFILEIFKTIRGYGGSAICASQDLYDFMSADNGRFGKGIINNSKTKIILNLEEDEAVRVQDALHLSDAEIMEITHFERGTGLISTNNNNVIVDFKASPLEKDLITTDRNELKEIAERLRRQKEAG